MKFVPDSTDLISQPDNTQSVFWIALNRFLTGDKRLSMSIACFCWDDKKLYLSSQNNTESLGVIHQKLPHLARFLKVLDFTAICVDGEEFLIKDLERVFPAVFKNLEGPLDRKLRLLQVTQSKAGFYKRLLSDTI